MTLRHEPLDDVTANEAGAAENADPVHAVWDVSVLDRIGSREHSRIGLTLTLTERAIRGNLTARRAPGRQALF
jgi:hypothetical protein